MTTNKKKIILVVASSLIMCALITIFIIFPTVKDIENIYFTIESTKKDLEQKYNNKQFIKNILEDYEKIEPQKTLLSSFFVPVGGELSFITDLEKIALKHNIVEPKFNKIIDKKASSKLTKLPLEINLDGNFHQIMGFISDLDSLPYYFNITDINIQSGKSNEKVFAKIIGYAFIGKNYADKNQ